MNDKELHNISFVFFMKSDLFTENIGPFTENLHQTPHWLMYNDFNLQVSYEMLCVSWSLSSKGFRAHCLVFFCICATSQTDVLFYCFPIFGVSKYKTYG